MAVRYHPGAGPWTGKVIRYGGFDYNFTGMARCAVGPELHRAVDDVTRNALGFAELIAPSDSPEYQAGFRSGVRVIPDFPDRSGADPPMARWGGYVQNVSNEAIAVEVGAKNTRRYKVLGKTLEWLQLVADD
jgi:hypothetical protein